MSNSKAVEQAVDHLKKGDVILCPTDTIYGLSCDATNEEAVNKIIDLKGRTADKSFIVLVNNDRMVNQCFKEIPSVVWDMIDLSDSPLTIVMDEGRTVAPNVLNPDGSLGMRMVKEGAAFDILQKFRKPIVSTSPNISGEPTPMEFDLIDEKISSGADYIFPNQGELKMSGKPSKIIRIRENGEVNILRK
jgi:L-threonylcarbamoyladenylate synthase